MATASFHATFRVIPSIFLACLRIITTGGIMRYRFTDLTTACQ
ncbi:hypothetical protein [Halomonas sp. hl-4]|nr:hypothetical protein [Halomonas sp. hl-4]